MTGAWVAAALALAAPASAQVGGGYGQNHVVLRDFHWQVRSTEHFDIHYYEESEALVPQAAEILERGYARASKALHADFDKRRPFFLYASVNDMQQSNIVEVGDGTGGVTESFKDRFMVYNDGSRAWLDDVTTHELTHVFQYAVLISGFWKSARILKAIVYPLWMMEGMAEYFTEGLDDSTEEYYVRDAATSGGLIPLWKLEHFSHLKPHQVTLAYKSGATAMRFLATQYGAEKIGDLLRLFESRFESSAVLQELVGMDLFAFDRKWREYLTEKYAHIAKVQRLQEPTAFGVSLTTAPVDIPEFNTSPVFTPDGRKFAFLSTEVGHPPALILQDVRTGRRRTLVSREWDRIENIEQGRFVNISRVLHISPDGNLLAFTAQKNHRDSIYLYDVRRGRLRRIPLPGFQTASSPSISPDGKRIAFAGMRDSFTDIYLYDLDTQEIRQLTNDPEDDAMPVFSPNGRSIVYSSEIVVEGDAMPYQRRLYKLDLETLTPARLVETRGAARDPMFSPDGRRIVFALELGGFHDLYELDTETGKVARLTRSLGASFTPVYAPNGDVAFCSFRRNSIHVYRAPRERLLNEPVEAEVLPKGAPRARLRPAPAIRWTEETAAPPAKPVARSTSALPSAVELSALPGMDFSTHTYNVAPPSTAPVTLGPSRPVPLDFSTDLFLPAMFYSSVGGLFAVGYWQGSDMLGNHQAGAQLALNTGQGYYSYQTQYTYARWRPQLSLAVAGLVYRNGVDLASGLNEGENVHAQIATMAYPLDRYHRIETSIGNARDSQRYPDDPTRNVINEARLTGAAFVRDTVGGRYLVPTYGSRLRLAYVASHEVLGGNTKFNTWSASANQYVPAGDFSTLALRLFAADSNGPNPQQFGLGGLGGLRGYGSSTVDNVGSRAIMGTAEFRFPLWTRLDYYMWYIFPDFYFKAITAAVFSDAGYAWNARHDLAEAEWNAVRLSYGVSLRIHTFILQLYPLVLSFDYARATTNSNNGVFYVYLGPLF